MIQVVLEQPAGALRCARRGETEHRIPEQKAKVPGNGRRTRGSESQGRRNQEWQEQSSSPRVQRSPAVQVGPIFLTENIAN